MYMVRVKQACLAHPEEQVTPTATEDKKEYSSTWSVKKVKYTQQYMYLEHNRINTVADTTNS